MVNRPFLRVSNFIYQAARPLIFRQSAQAAHTRIMRLLRWLDAHDRPQRLLQQANRWSLPHKPVTVGGVMLPHPLILAAGFVKGEGFADEAAALAAVQRGENIIPGWRSMPMLVGPVEFGSFTRWPRLGNPGEVMWRDAATNSTQNRVGLRNPGAQAAAQFLARQRDYLPASFGINIAVSPGVEAIAQQTDEVLQALDFFTQAGVMPAWVTLNISCPNTEDDPSGNQTENQTYALCQAASQAISVPLWVKVGPSLAPSQYAILMRVFAETGVRAVIATNTIGRPSPVNTMEMAGVGGGALHPYALEAAQCLQQTHSPIDIIGCGGILNHTSWQAFNTPAAQYWSALIYRGPLAAALILNEESHE